MNPSAGMYVGVVEGMARSLPAASHLVRKIDQLALSYEKALMGCCTLVSP